MKIRLLALMLAALTLLPVFAGCNSSDDAETTTADTTTAPEINNEPTPATPYGEAGLELMLNIVSDYYMLSNRLRSEPNTANISSVWGVASYIEALAETYRLYPDNQKIASAYAKALDRCLPQYEVKNTIIKTPSGSSYTVTYYNATAGSTGDYYYDDDAWLCIQFLNAYDLLGDEKYLKLAEETLEFLWTGWDDVLGGGIYWDKSYSGKNTCANGPVAISFLWAYQITQKAEYLERGKMIYDWTRSTLLDNDLYSDSISLDGNMNTWKAAYNQGVMIYAGAQLYEITGDETYYQQTKATMEKTIDHMFDGTGKRVTMAGNPIYKSWCIGWLTRGFIKYYTIDPEKDGTAMTMLETVLTKELKTKNKDGYYDPYFCTGDWGGESTTDILQPCGITSVFCLTHYYFTELNPAK